MIPKTALEVYQTYAQACDSQSKPRLIHNLRTALRLYILPEYGFEESRLRQDLEGCLAQISLSELIEGIARFIQQASNSECLKETSHNVSKGTVLNYKSVLVRFSKWSKRQYMASPSSENASTVAPPMSCGHTLNSLRRKGSSSTLAKEEILEPVKLQEELIQEVVQAEQLGFKECTKIISYLRQCCAEYNHAGAKRSETAVLRSWQRYLIIALLTYCPLKHRDILQLSQSNFRLEELDGSWIIGTQGLQRNSISRLSDNALPSWLGEDLTTWLHMWRPKIKTSHSFVFTRLGSNRVPESYGQPLTDRDISELISGTLYKATAVLFGNPIRINCQDLRQIVLVSKSSGLTQDEPEKSPHIVSGASVPKDKSAKTYLVQEHMSALPPEDSQAIKEHLEAITEIIHKNASTKNKYLDQDLGATIKQFLTQELEAVIARACPEVTTTEIATLTGTCNLVE